MTIDTNTIVTATEANRNFSTIVMTEMLATNPAVSLLQCLVPQT